MVVKFVRPGFGAPDDGYVHGKVFFDLARKVLRSRFCERYDLVHQTQYEPKRWRRLVPEFVPELKKTQERVIVPRPMISS